MDPRNSRLAGRSLTRFRIIRSNTNVIYLCILQYPKWIELLKGFSCYHTYPVGSLKCFEEGEKNWIYPNAWTLFFFFFCFLVQSKTIDRYSGVNSLQKWLFFLLHFSQRENNPANEFLLRKEIRILFYYSCKYFIKLTYERRETVEQGWI